ncbi:hypothetical protein PG996_005919 [Apiospora saccharicola]|uniref:Uncharacterized protein n=1 Tax=Apiospora saccharicola TaxID=335842 RepID=A0ABR1VMT7_9PEZI
MHPAPSLVEAFPKSEDPRAPPPPPPPPQQQQQQHQSQPQSQQQDQHQVLMQTEDHSVQRQHQQQPPLPHHQPENHMPASPNQSPQPARKDTASSTSTNVTDVTAVTNASSDTNATVYSVESSQSIFSVKDGAEVSNSRRASRRRTGPLSAQQREKAALIRKLGACQDCRRRRVACHPNHHNMTWEDAMRKYRSHSPMQELVPLAGRPISPASSNVALRHSYTQDPQDMDVDSTPTPPAHQTTPGRASLSDSRIRTPLPSGPRLDKAMTMPSLAAGPPSYTALPNIDSIKSELERTASRILSGPHRGRYSMIMVLLVCWQDDMDSNVAATVDELAEVLDKMYHYTIEVIRIPPSSSDGCKNSSRWLSRTINDFIDHSDTRDVLKVVYYNGGSFLDDNREMILASVEDMERASSIRWNGLQQTLEEACSDTLVLIDAPFYPSFKMVRQKGVLEIIAASTSQDQYNLIGRNSFTRALTEQLRSRLNQRPLDALSAAEFHSKLLALYPRIVHERHHGLDAVTRTPSPLHLQMSGNWRLPSITLAPLQFTQPKPPLFSPEANGGPQLNLSIRLTDESLNIESWANWLRMLPEGIKDVKVEGPYHTFR